MLLSMKEKFSKYFAVKQVEGFFLFLFFFLGNN